MPLLAAQDQGLGWSPCTATRLGRAREGPPAGYLLGVPTALHRAADASWRPRQLPTSHHSCRPPVRAGEAGWRDRHRPVQPPRTADLAGTERPFDPSGHDLNRRGWARCRRYLCCVHDAGGAGLRRLSSRMLTSKFVRNHAGRPQPEGTARPSDLAAKHRLRRDYSA
jgi:hypothetical protein